MYSADRYMAWKLLNVYGFLINLYTNSLIFNKKLFLRTSNRNAYTLTAN